MVVSRTSEAKESNMQGHYIFVDGVGADKSAKRLTRRHVMMGKNAGKTLTRGAKVKRQTPPSSDTVRAVNTAANSMTFKHTCNHRSQDCLGLNNPFGSRECSGLSLPVSIEPYYYQIIHEFFNLAVDRMYPLRFGFSKDDFKLMWLELLFADEASYHCSIALMQACNEMLQNRNQSSSKALHHLSSTFTQVRKRLESADALSDSTIALVVSLIHQEQIRKHHRAAKVHVKGLERMIALRGGLDDFEDNQFLLLKVCKTDLLFALQDGGPTIYYRDRMEDVRSTLAAKGLGLRADPEMFMNRHHQLDLPLREILSDVMSLCTLFNKKLGDETFDILLLLEMLVSICYRLLRFRPLRNFGRESDIQAAYHIGCIIFSMTVFLQFNSRRIIDYELISVCFQMALESKLLKHEDDLSLWLSMMGGIWISGDAGHDWIIPRIQAAAQRLGLDTWDDVRRSLIKFPWINAIHDEPGCKLWDQIKLGSSL